jgi:hypothetical protein
MTRAEALEQLRLGPGINEDVSTEYNDAVNMAIEALEQEPILDKIRAEIEGLQTYCIYSYTDLIERHEVFEIIDKYKAESEV